MLKNAMSFDKKNCTVIYLFFNSAVQQTGRVKQVERCGQAAAPRATAGLRTFWILCLCLTKISLFNIQVGLQIAFFYECLSSWPRIHLQMKPREGQPCPTERQDAFPLFAQHGSGGDRRHSLALLISFDSKQILFNSGIISLNVSLLRDIR